MKTLEFDSQIIDQDRIQVPPELALQIPAGSDVRVILLFDRDEDDDWRRMSMERLEAAYGEEDSVYELLVDEPAAR